MYFQKLKFLDFEQFTVFLDRKKTRLTKKLYTYSLTKFQDPMFQGVIGKIIL